MELRDYLRVLRRRWLLIVVTTLAALLAAGAFTALATPQYTSTTQLFVSTQDGSGDGAYQGGLFSAQRVTSYADLVTKSTDLASSVVDSLELDETPAEVRGQVSAAVVPDTVNLQITVIDPEPRAAQAKAQAYAEALVDLIRRLETPEQEGAAAPIKATIVDPASLSTSQVSPNPVRNLGLGLFLGLLLGVAIAVVRDLLDTRIKSAGDLDGVVDAPALGSIGYDATATKTPLISDLPPHSPRAEAFRVLRTNLQFVDIDSRQKVFVITSSVPDEGKTTTSINLALSLAQAGVRTVLVEGDLRRPKAPARLGLDAAVGVTSVLVGSVAVEDALQQHADTGLSFLASGAVPPNPAELLQSNAMSELLADLRSRFDVVIIDAPPLLPVTDATLLASKADGAILVVRHGKATKEQVRQSVARLEHVGARLLGTVSNMVPMRGKGYGYGYGYGYAPVDADLPSGTGRGH